MRMSGSKNYGGVAAAICALQKGGRGTGRDGIHTPLLDCRSAFPSNQLPM